MARLSEKYNDSVLKIFQLLKLLSAGEVPFSDLINIFADEVDGVKSNSHVVLNKYLNTLKIFGLKVKKKKSMYYLINTPFSMELDEEELKAVLLLKSASELLPEGKAKDSFNKFINDLEIRFSENTKSLLQSIATDDNFDLSIYFSKFKERINECETYCQEKQKLEISYVANDEIQTIICSPKEVKYQNRKVCFSVYNQLSRQIFDIPIDSIKSVRQLPTISSTPEISMTVVYKLKGQLAKSYRLKEWEYAKGFDEQGNLTVINTNEDFDVLFARLMKYADNCIIVSPKFLKERMIALIDKTLENYND